MNDTSTRMESSNKISLESIIDQIANSPEISQEELLENIAGRGLSRAQMEEVCFDTRLRDLFSKLGITSEQTQALIINSLKKDRDQIRNIEN